MPIKRITGVQLGVKSDDQILRESVVPVTTSELFEGDTPKPCGLFDPRMGPLDSRTTCPTDERGHIQCPGYPGHIPLALPILAYQYIRWIVKIMRCFCPMCSYPRFDVSDPTTRTIMFGADGPARLSRAVEISMKRRVCDRCGNILPRIIKKDRSMLHCIKLVYRVANNNEREVRFQPEMVKAVFEKITDADCVNIGLKPAHCRPEWFIRSVFPVPPPSMRPPARQSSQLPMHDDLTYTLCDIIKSNRALAKYLDKIRERLAESGDDAERRRRIEESSANAIDCYRRVVRRRCW